MTAARDAWIEIPNFPDYQHYKFRDPVWLRDYVRQLWHAEWSRLTLPQRGLLQTARLAYAHHDGLLLMDDLMGYVRTMERANVRAIAERLNHAGLLGLVASRPLSLKALTPLDVRAREASSNGRNPPTPPCPECGVGAGLHVAGCPLAVTAGG
jgi:hypothetical protein